MAYTVTFDEEDFYPWAESVGCGEYQSKSKYWARTPADLTREIRYWHVPARYLPMGVTEIRALRIRPQTTFKFIFHVTFASEAAATLVALGRG